MFTEFDIIFLNQRRTKDSSNNEPHFHNIIELIVKKSDGKV